MEVSQQGMGVDKLVILVSAQVLWVLTLDSGLTIIGGWSTLMVLIIFIHSIIKLLPRPLAAVK